MRALMACTTVLLLLGAPALGSLVEDATDGLVHYQADGGGDGDAPDTCLDNAAGFASVIDGDVGIGMLVPEDDEEDVYRLAVATGDVGKRLQVVGLPSGTSPYDVRIDVEVPDCQGSVADPANQPVNATAPPAPATGQTQVTPHSMAGTCGQAWKFIINQVDSVRAPASIHLRWTDGATETVPLEKVTSAGVAHYETSTDTGHTLENAWANIYAGWEGRFNMGEQICNGTVGTIPTNVVDLQDHRVTFTPMEAGTYTVHVRYVPPEVAGQPIVVPVSCHVGCRDVLSALGDATGYGVSTDTVT